MKLLPATPVATNFATLITVVVCAFGFGVWLTRQDFRLANVEKSLSNIEHRLGIEQTSVAERTYEPAIHPPR